MGTTSQKLTYLNDTKTLLKQKINNLGGSITDETTFREYAEELDTIYSNLPKTSYGEGTELSLTPTLKGKLDYEDDKVGYGDTEQNNIVYIQTEWEQGEVASSTGQDTPNLSVIRTKGYTKVYPNILYKLSRTVYSSYMNFRFYDSSYTYLGTQTVSEIVTTNRTNNRMNANESSIEMTINNINVAYMRMVDYTNDLSTVYTIYTEQTPSPSYPQNIEVVTGEQEVVVSGKNMYDGGERTNTSGSAINTSLNTNNSSVFYGLVPISLIQNYLPITFSSSIVLDTGVSYTDTNIRTVYYNSSKTAITTVVGSNASASNTVSSLTITSDNIPENAYYFDLRVRMQGNGYTEKTQLNVGTERGTYMPYVTPQTLTLNLGSIELNKIGDYQDYIYKTGGNWYKKEVIKKRVINNFNTTEYSNLFYASVNDYLVQNAFSNCFVNVVNPNIASNSGASTLSLEQFTFRMGTTKDRVYVKTSLSKNDLDTLAPIFYYPLATANDVLIEDTTLINQLEAIYNAKSYNGTTHITSSGSLPMIMKVRALKGE